MLIYMLIFFVTQCRKSTDKSLVKNIIIIILQDIFPQKTLFQIVYITTYVNVQKMDCDHPLYQNIRDFPFIFFRFYFLLHDKWHHPYRLDISLQIYQKMQGIFFTLIIMAWSCWYEYKVFFWRQTIWGSFNLFLCCICQDSTLKL